MVNNVLETRELLAVSRIHQSTGLVDADATIYSAEVRILTQEALDEESRISRSKVIIPFNNKAYKEIISLAALDISDKYGGDVESIIRHQLGDISCGNILYIPIHYKYEFTAIYDEFRRDRYLSALMNDLVSKTSLPAFSEYSALYKYINDLFIESILPDITIGITVIYSFDVTAPKDIYVIDIPSKGNMILVFRNEKRTLRERITRFRLTVPKAYKGAENTGNLYKALNSSSVYYMGSDFRMIPLSLRIKDGAESATIQAISDNEIVFTTLFDSVVKTPTGSYLLTFNPEPGEPNGR